MSIEQLIKKLKLEAIVRGLIREANATLDAFKGEEKEVWVTSIVYSWLETVDGAIPLLGIYMDFPLVDAAQREGVRRLVKFIFDKMEAEGSL